MGAIGWIVVVAFLATIAVIVYKAVHSEPEPEPEPKPEPVEPISGEKKTPNYVTVYEFNPKKNVKVCCCCDGENTWDARRCCICGEKIDV